MLRRDCCVMSSEPAAPGLVAGLLSLVLLVSPTIGMAGPSGSQEDKPGECKQTDKSECQDPGSGKCEKSDVEVQRHAIQDFYKAVMAFDDGGLPSRDQIKSLAPFISTNLEKLLLVALETQEKINLELKDPGPPLVEGAFYCSLFEGAQRLGEINFERENPQPAFLVTLEYGDYNKDAMKPARWKDRVFLVKEEGLWVVDDIEFMGDWDFAFKGRLSERLKWVADPERNPSGPGAKPVEQGAAQPQDTVGPLYLGMAVKDLVTALGEPEEKTEPTEWGADGLWHSDWKYSKLGVFINVAADAKDASYYVNFITIYEPCLYKTNKGISIGSKREDVEKAYPSDTWDKDFCNDTTIVVGSYFGGILFELEKGIVTAISFGAFAE